MVEQTTQTESLLSPRFMHTLDRLDVMSRKILRGKQQGERRSKKKGQSVEFADYRNYVVGDDLRFIDWNLYARLDRLFIRLFMEEEDLCVSLVIDASASMDYGKPNKLLYAKRVAAALAYIALVHHNRVNLYAFNDTIIDQAVGMRGRRPIPQMLEFLDRQNPTPDTAAPGYFEQVCKQLTLTQRQPGVVILLSDFLDKGDLSASLRYLGSDRYDVYGIQLISPQEMNPVEGDVVGDLRLRDIEDGDIAEVSVTQALVQRYKTNLQAYCEHVREQCLRRGIMYLMSETSVPFDVLVLKYLRQRGLLG